MTIQRKVYFGIGLFACIALLTAGLIFRYSLMVDRFQRGFLQSEKELLAATSLRAAVRGLVLDTYQDAFETRRGFDAEKFEMTSVAVVSRFRDYESAVEGDFDDETKHKLDRSVKVELAEIDHLKHTYDAINLKLRAGVEHRKAGKVHEAEHDLIYAREVLFQKDFLEGITESIDAERQEIDRNSHGLSDTSTVLRWALMVLAALALLKGAVLFFFLSRTVVGRLNSLHYAIRTIADGNLDYVAPFEGNDEISELFVALNKMAGNLILANAELHATHQRYQQIMESTSEGIWCVNENKETVYVNPQMAKMLGYEVSEIIGKHLDQFINEKDRALRDSSLERNKSEGAQRLEIEFVKKDGSSLKTKIASNTIFDLYGQSNGAIAIISDITEQRKVEEQFLHAQKMEAVGQLAGGIAHDFNNVLGVILMQSDLLLDMDPNADSAEYSSGICEIRDAADRAAGLTRQLLTFSRKQAVELKRICLSATVREMSKMIGRLVGEDIQIVMDLDEDGGDIKADTAQVQQVIMNLVVNARDAMPKGGTLSLSTRSVDFNEKSALVYGVPPGGYITLSVTDTGCGMSEEVKRRVFDPFFTTKEVGKGTGLGLATVFGIMKQNGGNAAVYSEPGMGSSFKVFFPRAIGVRLPENEPIPSPEETKCEAVGSILLIEDEPGLCRLTRDMLVSHGYHVCTAANGAKAFSIYGEEMRRFDLVLTDVIMPEMNGPEFVEKVASDLEIYGIRVLFVSGFSDGKLDAHGISTTSENFMEKPYSMKELLEKVGEMLASKAKSEVKAG